MASSERITLFYAPHSRSTGTRILFDELGVDYDLHILNLKTGEQRRPDHLAVNPLGKVPTIRHRGAVITEQVAIAIYAADLYPEAGLTPAIDDPLRGPYLRFLAFYGASFEPAVIDHYRKVEPAAKMQTPYSSYDEMLSVLEAQLQTGPYLFGERLTAADIFWGTALAWTTSFGLVPMRPAFKAFIERMTARPIYQRVKAEEAELAAEHAKTAETA